MKLTKSHIFLLVLLSFFILIRLIGRHPYWVEVNYSNGVFIYLSKAQRLVFGSLPFSFGDCLYGLVFLWLVYALTSFLKILYNRQVTFQFLKNKSFILIIAVLFVVVLFDVLWGINYSRTGIAWQIGIDNKKYTRQDLEMMNKLLAEKVNLCKERVVYNKLNYPDNQQLYIATEKAYSKVAVAYPFLQYNHASIKSSLWGWLGNYWGFTGYYDPFTGEAQLNTTVPRFILPFAACHEVAHQLGYAREKEANFVAFLTAKSSNDSLLLYSTYFDLFFYANRTLFLMDSSTAKSYRKLLNDGVRNDVKELVRFNESHRNFMEPAITFVYNWFLKSNKQPSGMLSYDEVTGLLIGYYRKHGDI